MRPSAALWRWRLPLPDYVGDPVSISARRTPPVTVVVEEGRRRAIEGLRLAALRYLVRMRGARHAAALGALMSDPSPRVRRAAIQLVARVDGASIDEGLADVLADGARPLAERLLAAAGLETRRCETPFPLAQRLLPALALEWLREPAVAIFRRPRRRSESGWGPAAGSGVRARVRPRMFGPEDPARWR